jgi:hypothetical protein
MGHNRELSALQSLLSEGVVSEAACTQWVTVKAA